MRANSWQRLQNCAVHHAKASEMPKNKAFAKAICSASMEIMQSKNTCKKFTNELLQALQHLNALKTLRLRNMNRLFTYEYTSEFSEQPLAG